MFDKNKKPCNTNVIMEVMDMDKKTWRQVEEITKEKPVFACLTAKTEVKLNRKSKDKTLTNPFGKVYKVEKKVIGLNFDYETRVNNALAKEDKLPIFEAGKASGRKHVDGFKGLTVDDKTGSIYYANIFLFSNTKSISKNYVTETGESVRWEEIEPFFPTKKPNETWQAGLEKKVDLRAYKLENILSIKVLDRVFI